MRDIKFRAWHNELKIMLYPPDILDSMPYCRPHTEKEFTDRYSYVVKKRLLVPMMTWEGSWFQGGEKQDAVLLQYTGIKDENGKEIYEGDIVRYDTEDGIKRSKVEFQMSDEEDHHISGLVFIYICNEYSTLDSETCDIEVIGNIYENPELLK
jgi:uncharacterized phage protein (TIGR01671 family)